MDTDATQPETGHLAECGAIDRFFEPCICPWLRAYGERRERELGAKYLILVDEQQAIGYAKGLADARDALLVALRLAQPEDGDITLDAFAAELGIDLAQVRADVEAGTPRAVFER